MDLMSQIVTSNGDVLTDPPMPPRKPSIVPAATVIESRIQIVRGVRVMFDSDLAELYEVPTKALNQAVDRNLDRFPEDFDFRLTRDELDALRAQHPDVKTAHGGARKLPRVFTEHGVAMLSGVLHSETAVRVNIEIIRAFVRLRRLLATPGELVAQLQKLAQTVELHDTQIKAIIDVLQRMMAPPPAATPKRRIGFVNTDNEATPEDKK